MFQRILKIVIIIRFCLLTNSGDACTIFMANDGQHVWIGNNEDERQDLRYRFWFYPSRHGDYGYTIWTELAFGNLLNGFSYINPQGGLNEYGLFMDYTFIQQTTLAHDDQKEDRKKQVVTEILRTCKTVEEALVFISKYNLVKLSSAQLFMGDASGNYATVTGGNIVRKSTPGFALTNYCINNGYQEACHRRDVANHYLGTKSSFQLEDIRMILDKSAQKLPNNLISNYSMAVNLKTATVYIYYKTDFTTAAVFSLHDQLAKGKHHTDLEAFFPASLRPVLERAYKANGVNAVIEQYTTLRKTKSATYNFNNDDVLQLAIMWIGEDSAADALKLLNCLKQYEPENLGLFSWLGVAYRKMDSLDASRACFSKVLAQQPDDYLATLWGRQENQKLIFKLADFEEAAQVSLIGEFTEWTRHPIRMQKQNGYWYCEISLPKGTHRYKFIVNDQYLADSKNFLHTGSGPDVFSRIYVW